MDGRLRQLDAESRGQKLAGLVDLRLRCDDFKSPFLVLSGTKLHQPSLAALTGAHERSEQHQSCNLHLLSASLNTSASLDDMTLDLLPPSLLLPHSLVAGRVRDLQRGKKTLPQLDDKRAPDAVGSTMLTHDSRGPSKVLHVFNHRRLRRLIDH